MQEGGEGTLLVIPATEAHQLIEFTTDNKTLELFIDSNSVMLSDEAVNALAQ